MKDTAILPGERLTLTKMSALTKEGPVTIRDGKKKPMFIIKRYSEVAADVSLAELEDKAADAEKAVKAVLKEKAELEDKIKVLETPNAELAERDSFIARLDDVVEGHDTEAFSTLAAGWGFGEMLKTAEPEVQTEVVAEVAEPVTEPEKPVAPAPPKPRNPLDVIAEIHNSLVNGQRQQMVKQINKS